MTFQKGQMVTANGKNLKCILADHEYALFGKITREVEDDGTHYFRTDFEDLCVYDNTGTVKPDYVTILSLD